MLNGKKKASRRKGGFERWVKTWREEAAEVELKQWSDPVGKITDVKRGEGTGVALGDRCHLEGSLGQGAMARVRAVAGGGRWPQGGGFRSGLDTNEEEGTNRYCEFAVVGGKGEKVWGEAHSRFVGTAGWSGQEGALPK